jgi:hypothetical protein
MIKFKELQEALEDLKKNVNQSYSSAQNAGSGMPASMGTSGGQTGMYRSEDMDKNVAPPATMNLSEDEDDNMKKQTMNPSAGGAQDMMVVKFEKNGQWRMEKAAHYASEDGKNREANPKLRQSDLGPGGKVHMIKDEGTNEEANPTQPHNKGKFKVMPLAPEKDSKREDVNGKPYNGKDKDIKKGEHQGNEAKGFDENRAPGRGNLSV